MAPLTADWDAEIVRSLFCEVDAKTILSISIREGMEDHLAWHFDPKGMFSVKSAYKVAVMLRDRKSGLEAGGSVSCLAKGSSFDWNHIWQLKVPRKMQMFVWRLAHNSLANRMKIQRLGIELDTKCPVCNRLNEDGGHIFLKCKKARSCWSILGLGELRETLLSCVSPRDLLQEIWKCSDTIQVRVVTFLWEWWNIHNKANAGEGCSEPAVVCSRVERLLIDFLILKKPAKPPKPPDIQKWARPPEDHVKVNFDGSYNANSGNGGWGYVIRDQAGNFIAAGAGKSRNLGSAIQSEAVACLAAIRGADRVGANRIIFESDSSNLVQGLKTRDYDKSEIGVLVKEARSLCILNFSSFQFSFSRRTCNNAAHELAKLGANSESEDSFWDVSAPGCIATVMASDLAGPV